MMLLGRLDRHDIVAFVIDLREELSLVVAGVEVIHHADLAVRALVRDVERRRHDDLVVLLDLAVDRHIDLAVPALDLLDRGVESCRVL